MAPECTARILQCGAVSRLVEELGVDCGTAVAQCVDNHHLRDDIVRSTCVAAKAARTRNRGEGNDYVAQEGDIILQLRQLRFVNIRFQRKFQPCEAAGVKGKINVRRRRLRRGLNVTLRARAQP